VDGSKNAALPLLAAAACLQQQVRLWGVPACADVEAMLSLLRRLGWTVSRRRDLSQVTVGTVHPQSWQLDLAEAAAIRASYYLVAPLIIAYGGARLPWPGGCSVGVRGMELHFAVYEAFGDRVDSGTGGYTVRAVVGRAAARCTSLCRSAAAAPPSPHCCARWWPGGLW
jgi:UDP-N-acetylglucosamine 1-carboxyvinyltransferase